MKTLYLCVHLPLLTLETIRPRWCEALPFAVTEHGRVLVASACAERAGIEAGMQAASMTVLLPEIIVAERNAEQEQHMLTAVAMALLQFTPEVDYFGSASIVLDVSASLRFFGGPLALCRRLRACVLALGVSLQLGAAPSAMGAYLLAHAMPSRNNSLRRRVLKTGSLQRRLNRLPFLLLPQAPVYAELLQGIGCRSLGDLRKLPRAGLQRRSSPDLLQALDQAYGESVELFNWIKVAASFSARVETYDRLEHAQALFSYCRSLILQMTGWLVSLQRAVTHITLYFEHERGRAAIAPTCMDIQLAQAAWYEDHVLVILKERLAHLELPAPVIAVRLHIQQTVEMQTKSASLFPEPGAQQADFQRLLEVLSARLGADQVVTPRLQFDHRPELANRWQPAHDQVNLAVAKKLVESDSVERPFWLLPQALPLTMQNERPYYRSPLTLIRGPERIESGWWDNQIAARDYFIAQAKDGSCYWIYLERGQQASWFLHGLYA